MSQPYKIAIAGIGGVGAFYGGLLAKEYKESSSVSITFIARDSHLQAIKQNGLQLQRENGVITSFPHNATDNPKELGKLDLIVFCCKAYDLESFALSFSENISKEVKVTGDLNQLLLGNPEIDKKELERIAEIFKATGANVSTDEDIKLKLWEKYSFVSPMATATSAFNNSVSEILGDSEKKQSLQQLMEEVVLLSQYENINLPTDIVNVNLAKLSKLPAEATSSLHNDFKANKKTELETLTGYVVRQSEKLGIQTPTYKQLYALLKDKTIS
jgi:2-dehydropantoate 2-reductase